MKSKQIMSYICASILSFLLLFSSELYAAGCKKPKKTKPKKESVLLEKKDEKKNGSLKSIEAQEILKIYEEGTPNIALAKAQGYQASIENSKTATEVRLLGVQIASFIKSLNDCQAALNLGNAAGIISSAEAAIQIDLEISKSGSINAKSLKKMRAKGYFLAAIKFEKEDKYSAADDYVDNCLEDDPGNADCKRWVENKETLVKKIYSKAKTKESFNPQKADELYQEIMKIVRCDNEYYKKAEAASQAIKK